MLREGFEPSRICVLNAARLPIAPPEQKNGVLRGVRTRKKSQGLNLPRLPIPPPGQFEKWCCEKGSNLRRLRLQRSALPTELSQQKLGLKIQAIELFFA